MQPISIIITEGYSEIAPLAGVGRAFYGTDIRFCSPDGGALTSVAGLHIADTVRFDPPSSGVVVVCGGPAFERDDGPDLTQRLAQAQANGCIVAGICGGTIALARARLLDNARHTSNGPHYLSKYAPSYKGGTHYVDQPRALRDRDLITAAAPMPATFAMEVLKAAGLGDSKVEEIPALLTMKHGRAPSTE